jgi:putative DNA primase/helicase
VGWERIVAIIDAAGPIEPPAIPESNLRNKSARRQPRSNHPFSAADGVGSSPTSPAGPAPPPAAPGGNVVSFRATSQTGALSEKPASAESGGGGSNDLPPITPADDDGDDLHLRLAFYPRTDLGNAERFRERSRGKLLWCPALGWLAWDGRRWRREGSEEKIKVAEHDTVRALQDESRVLKNSGRDYKIPKGKDMILLSEALAMWGRASEQANRLAPIAKRAAPYLHIAPDKLDADPFKINVDNGTLVIRKTSDGTDCISFKQHDPADLITKCSRVVYDAAAAAPIFDDFFAYVQPKIENRRFLLQWQGLSLTGDVTDQKLCVFWGKGKNGKSTFIDICAFAGGDYSETIPIETFLNEGRGRNAGQATPDLAILPGVRHLRTSEPDRGAKLAEALIKLATGGEPLQARHLNRDYFKFYPQFKLTISGNYRPQIVGADEGIWRRVELVPWSITVPTEKIDRHLGEKLRAEASGILNRLLDGLRDWFEHGLVTPADVTAATADYRRDSDPCGRFLEGCVIMSKDDRVRSSEMHALFCAWGKANSVAEWSQKGLAMALKERGFVSKHSDVMWWLGVKLKHTVSDFVDSDGRVLKGDSRDVKAPGGVNEEFV